MGWENKSRYDMWNSQSGIKHFLSHVTKIWYFKKFYRPVIKRELWMISHSYSSFWWMYDSGNKELKPKNTAWFQNRESYILLYTAHSNTMAVLYKTWLQIPNIKEQINYVLSPSDRNISALHGAIWRIMKYFMQGDDFQAGRKHIKSFKGMPPGQIIYVGRY